MVKTYTGHGVGFALHEPPVVPHYGRPGTGTLLQEGMAPLRSGRALFLTDGTFDPAKPFRIVVTLRPGQTHLGSVARVRTTAGRLR